MSPGTKGSTGGQKSSGPSKRGFAAMDPQKQRQIASMGGKAAHAKGTAHEFTSEEARRAGQKGGESVSRNREHMAAIGRKGGESSSSSSRGSSSSSSSSSRGSSSSTSSRGGSPQQHAKAGSQSHKKQ